MSVKGIVAGGIGFGLGTREIATRGLIIGRGGSSSGALLPAGEYVNDYEEVSRGVWKKKRKKKTKRQQDDETLLMAMAILN